MQCSCDGTKEDALNSSSEARRTRAQLTGIEASGLCGGGRMPAASADPDGQPPLSILCFSRATRSGEDPDGRSQCVNPVDPADVPMQGSSYSRKGTVMRQQEIDLIAQLEHDHHHLDRMVEAVDEAMQAALRGERSPDEIQGEILEFLSVAEDEIYEHFDREEQGLFPFVLETMPESTERIRSLESAHDRMCGALSRMNRLASQDASTFGEEFDAFVAIFARFEANYSKHSSNEWALLRELAERVDNDQRGRLADILRNL